MKNQTEALEHASVRQYCKAVRMPSVGANFVTLTEQAVKENHSHIQYLEALLAGECEERDRHAIANRIPALPYLYGNMSCTTSDGLLTACYTVAFGGTAMAARTSFMESIKCRVPAGNSSKLNRS